MSVLVPTTPRPVANSSQVEQTIEEAFPDVACTTVPFGNLVIVQVRLPKKRTRGGIVLPDETRDAAADTAQIAKILAVGPVAFKNRTTLEEWPEKQWCSPGQFVRTPKYLNDYWFVRSPNSDEPIKLAMCRDTDLLGREDDPLAIASYIV